MLTSIGSAKIQRMAPTHQLPRGIFHPLLAARICGAWRMSWTKKYRNAAPTTIRNVLPITRGAGGTSELGAADGSIGKDDSTEMHVDRVIRRSGDRVI